jgi:lycopene cyclase domain-containing protein
MDLYTRIDLLIMAVPLALSFDRRVAFWRKWPQVWVAIAVVMAVFIPWDIWKTVRGGWGLNPEYAGAWRCLHLPLGEWLFFICVPYACLFILECVRGYIPDRVLGLSRRGVLVVAAGLAAAAWLLRHRIYSGTVVLSAGGLLAAMEWAVPATLRSRHFWVALVLSYLPFLAANGLLTALPIVWYDPARILGIRVGSIPWEDFFYSFSMLLLAILVHDSAGRWRRAA